MSIKTLNYTVTLEGVIPSYERRAGVRYDHNKTQLQFVLDNELYNKLYETVSDGSLHYRFEIYDGEGSKHLGEVYSLESIILKPLCLSYWVTKFGGKLKVNLVVTLSNNNISTTEFTTEVALSLDDLPESDIDESNYKSLTTLNLQTADYAQKVEKIKDEVSNMHNEIGEIKSMLEQGEWVFDNNSDIPIDVDFTVDNDFDQNSKNAIANGIVTKRFDAIENNVKESFANINANVYDSMFERVRDEVLQAAYPIGSYYWSSSPINPVNLFGGSWEQIKDVFILAAGDEYTAGTTGGAATHMLTTAEMPSHSHWFKHDYNAGGKRITVPASYGKGRTSIKPDGAGDYYPAHWAEETWGTTNSGSGMSHNNMPPYLVAYCFRRTA